MAGSVGVHSGCCTRREEGSPASVWFHPGKVSGIPGFSAPRMLTYCVVSAQQSTVKLLRKRVSCSLVADVLAEHQVQRCRVT